MKAINKIAKMAVLSVFGAIMLGSPLFAIENCIGNANSKYPNLSMDSSQGVFCQRANIGSDDNPNYVSIYGKSSADCAQAAALLSNPDECKGDDLNGLIKTIINTIVFAVGMAAVIMIILGGITYATSQGDTTKVKKGTDTILYGIIGLVIAILAYAIVNFVLAAITGQ